jgi:hypothetical protein
MSLRNEAFAVPLYNRLQARRSTCSASVEQANKMSSSQSPLRANASPNAAEIQHL